MSKLNNNPRSNAPREQEWIIGDPKLDRAIGIFIHNVNAHAYHQERTAILRLHGPSWRNPSPQSTKEKEPSL